MKSPTLLKTYLIAALLLIAGISNATNYYVDPSSTASTANGAQATPWKTMAQVQSAMSSFQPGDFIYFKKGQTFNGTLNVTKSGTAGAPITFATYGTGNAPIFTTTASDLFTVNNRSYIVFDGFKITDFTLDPNDRNQQAIIDRAFEIDGCTYVTVKNMDISLVGVGVNMVSNYCTMDNCTIGNLRMIRNTQGGDDDYGANPIVISGSNNNVTSNYFKDCWAYSYDYTYDGGAIEVYGANNNGNKIMYNTAVNCDGFMEIGYNGGGSSDNNMVAYNKIINCGELVYISNSGQYSTTVNNLMFYNNNIVHTVNQLTMPTSMIGMSASSSTANIVNMKNNIFWLTTGIDVARSGKFSGTQLTHEDNIYHLGTGSVLNFTIGASELTTTATLFTSTAGTDPTTWNYAPATGSPAIDFGQNLGMARDFAGNAVPSTPNAGILESAGTGGSTLAASSSATAISCNGGTATVTVSATGGTAPYTGTGTFTVSAGTYTYTVTDAAGTSKTTSITVSQPSVLAATLSAGTILVIGGTTTLTVNATGGTAPYSYKLNTGSYQSSNVFSSVLAGIQTVTVKDANGCTTSALSITILGPSAPALALTASAGTISCNGGSTTVTATATGGTSPYTYKLNSGSYQSSSSFSSVAAGTQTVTVKDAAGTTQTATVTIAQPAAISATLSAGTITTTGGTTTLTVSATGGTGAYTYKLNSGSYQSANSFTGVAAGTYTVTIKDANSCTATASITITETVSGTLTVTATGGTISCNGGTTTITASGSGGKAPYTFKLNSGSYQSSGTFTNVAAGTHTVTIKDANGTTATKTVVISQPAAITVAVAAGTVTGTSGTTTATITVAGGTPSYTYKLDAGSYQSSNTFSGVTAGNHTVTVRDGKSCTAVKTFTVLESGTSPLVISAVAGTIVCNGSTTSITISATGGRAPYTGTGNFIVGAGTYTYTVTDADGTTGTTSITVAQPAAIVVTATAGTITTSGGTTTITTSASGGSGMFTYKLNSGSYQSSGTFTNVAAGTYTITVKDSKGCTATKSITVSQSTSTTFRLTLVSKTNETCKGKKDGKIVVAGSGGTAPYTYRINYGAYQSSGTFSNLRPGFYIVTGKSATGVTSTLYLFISASNTACKTGSRENGSSVESTNDVKKTNELEGLKINAFPNPTTTEFNLVIENGSDEQAYITVMNMNGQKVYETRGKTFEKKTFGKDFVSGNYIIRVIQGNATKTLNVIKAK